MQCECSCNDISIPLYVDDICFNWCNIYLLGHSWTRWSTSRSQIPHCWASSKPFSPDFRPSCTHWWAQHQPTQPFSPGIYTSHGVKLEQYWVLKWLYFLNRVFPIWVQTIMQATWISCATVSRYFNCFIYGS